MNNELEVVHGFDIRMHENQCETGNEGQSVQYNSKIWAAM